MAKKAVNRNPVVQWEVTFPKYKDANEQSLYGKVTAEHLSSEEVDGKADLRRDTFAILCLPPVRYQCVCQEDHEDDTKHLHLGVKLVNGITKSKLLKFIKARLPEDYKRVHISAIQSWDNWRNYCKKEDPHFYEDGTLSEERAWWRSRNGRLLIQMSEDDTVRRLWAIYERTMNEEAAEAAAARIDELNFEARFYSEREREQDVDFLNSYLGR